MEEIPIRDFFVCLREVGWWTGKYTVDVGSWNLSEMQAEELTRRNGAREPALLLFEFKHIHASDC